LLKSQELSAGALNFTSYGRILSVQENYDQRG